MFVQDSNPASQSGHLRCVRLTLARLPCTHRLTSRQVSALFSPAHDGRLASFAAASLHSVPLDTGQTRSTAFVSVGRKLARLPTKTFVRSRKIPNGNGREASPGHVGCGTPAISREPGSSAEKVRTHCGAASVSETSPPSFGPASCPHPDPLVAVRSNLRSVIEDSESLAGAIATAP